METKVSQFMVQQGSGLRAFQYSFCTEAPLSGSREHGQTLPLPSGDSSRSCSDIVPRGGVGDASWHICGYGVGTKGHTGGLQPHGEDSGLFATWAACCPWALPLTVSAVTQSRSWDQEGGKGPTVSLEGPGRWDPGVEGMLGLQPSQQSQRSEFISAWAKTSVLSSFPGVRATRGLGGDFALPQLSRYQLHHQGNTVVVGFSLRL